MSLGKSSALTPVYVLPNAATPKNPLVSGRLGREGVVRVRHPSDIGKDAR
jgi:hypothetical protein